MSIKQTLKNFKIKTKDEIDLWISSLQVLSATTPVISNKPEHSETILSTGPLDAIYKNASKLSNKVQWRRTVKTAKYWSKNGVAMGLRKFKESFPKLTESTARTFHWRYKKKLKLLIRKSVQFVLL